MILRGELEPMDICRETILKTYEWEPKVRAWENYDVKVFRKAFPHSLKAEQIRDKPLASIPFGIKDIFNTEQFPTSMGSPLWKGFRAGNNARVVQNLVDHGAVPFGKTVTAEFAVHHLNKTRNPWDTRRTPGTSSSGSAAAVACGMVPFCLGTQTAASIARPASFCGVWGMKPTFGIVPRTGSLKTTDSLDTVGFLTSRGENLKPILDAIRVRGQNHPFVHKYVDRSRILPKKLRIVFLKTSKCCHADPEILNGLEKFKKALKTKKNISVDEITLTGPWEGAHQTHETIYNKSLEYYFKNEAKQGSQISPIMRAMIEQGKKFKPLDFMRALKKQEILIKRFSELMNPYDFAVSLATTTVAPFRNVREKEDPSLIWTLCHGPCVIFPYEQNHAGLPFGLQLLAKKYHDFDLCDWIEGLLEEDIIHKRTTTP